MVTAIVWTAASAMDCTAYTNPPPEPDHCRGGPGGRIRLMKQWFAAVLALVAVAVVGTVVVQQEVPAQAAAPQAAKVGQAALAAFDPQVDALLARMNPDEKIGQMTQAEQGELSKDFSEVGSLFLGSVFSGGNSDPSPANTVQDWTDMYDRLQQQALRPA